MFESEETEAELIDLGNIKNVEVNLIMTAGSGCPASGADRLYQELGTEKKTLKSVPSDGHEYYVVNGGPIIAKSLIGTIENGGKTLIPLLVPLFSTLLFIS